MVHHKAFEIMVNGAVIPHQDIKLPQKTDQPADDMEVGTRALL